MNAASLLRAAANGLARLARQAATTAPPTRRHTAPSTRRDPGPAPGPGSGPGSGRQDYPGDYTGPLHPVYAPEADDDADPGEVVWAWVPYEEDHRRGKDRPALVVARDGRWLLALPVTSKDHDRDAAEEAAAGRHWIDIGSGAWDARGRSSEARVDRVVRLAPRAVRRMGGRVDRRTFELVAAEMARHR